DDSGVKCWGNNIYGVLNVPAEIKNPVSLVSAEYEVCALEDEKIRCWGGSSQKGSSPFVVSHPVLRAANPLVIGGLTLYEGESPYVCARDASSVVCWHLGTAEPLVFPGLKNPVQVAVRDRDVCVLDDEGLKCWDYKSQPDLVSAPLGHVRGVFSH